MGSTVKQAQKLFQHTATRRWLRQRYICRNTKRRSFNTQPPEGGCLRKRDKAYLFYAFQHTATRRWLPIIIFRPSAISMSFNTQPPEGGCVKLLEPAHNLPCFNTQPPEGGCFANVYHNGRVICVSTHSHPKVAAILILILLILFMFQHTATRRWLLQLDKHKIFRLAVSTHSHPKVAACKCMILLMLHLRFQHTATRRWLPAISMSRAIFQNCFNTQPPEGGCMRIKKMKVRIISFNTQPPEGGCSLHKKARKISKLNTVFR